MREILSSEKCWSGSSPICICLVLLGGPATLKHNSCYIYSEWVATITGWKDIAHPTVEVCFPLITEQHNATADVAANEQISCSQLGPTEP